MLFDYKISKLYNFDRSYLATNYALSYSFSQLGIEFMADYDYNKYVFQKQLGIVLELRTNSSLS